MTKKHFVALAAALRTLPIVNKEHRLIVNRVADVCAQFNKNFDRARFLAACGVETK